MNKIVFLNRYFFPDHSATSQLLSDLCFSLADKGHRIHVVTSRQLYENPNARLAAEEDVHGVKVHRVWTSQYGRQRLRLRAVDYLTFYLAAGWRLMNLVSRDDVIVAETDPPIISFVAWLAARLKGAHPVNWLHDLYPDVAYALKVSNIHRYGWLLRWLRDASLRGARMNIAISSKMAERVLGTGISPQKIRTIHNWSDKNEIFPVPKSSNPLRRQWGLGDQFVVGYSGNMGRVHEFETILGAVDRLSDRSDITFLFIGSGAQREWLESGVRSRSLSNVVFKPSQPRAELNNVLSAPDVHLVSLLPEMEGLIVPSKFYGIAAAGRPTIYVGDPGGEIPGILRSADCGVTLAVGDVDGLVQWIVKLKDDQTLAAKMGSNARLLLEGQYDKALALQAWEALLSDIAI
jgi:glycosyltransferase involved in cell wall biosynthesis